MANLHLELEPPQVYLAVAKGASDGYVPILPALAQELRTYLSGPNTTYLFESNRRTHYSPRAIQLVVRDAAKQAGLETSVTPHRLPASVATRLLDAGMYIDQVQTFLRYRNVCTTQIYAETSIANLKELPYGPVETTLRRPLLTRVTGRNVALNMSHA